MRAEQQYQGSERDKVRSDVGRSVLEQFFCEGRPDVLVGNAVVATRVLELLEVALDCVEGDVHSGRM
jgi:hypothetical protein